MIIPIPIFIRDCDDDLSDFDYMDGFGDFVIAYLIGCIGTIPLTYSIIGCIRGFDAWGLNGVSFFIGLMVGIIVVMLVGMVVD